MTRSVLLVYLKLAELSWVLLGRLAWAELHAAMEFCCIMGSYLSCTLLHSTPASGLTQAAHQLAEPFQPSLAAASSNLITHDWPLHHHCAARRN